MAYELSNPIRRVGPQNSGGPTIWTYADGDAIATIDGSGYFNLDAGKLQVGDLIYCVGNGVPGLLWVSGNTRDMTASPPVEGVVDCNNTLALSTIDSD
jgi:hypothetical protein